MKKEPSPKPTGKNLPEIGPLAGMTIKELEKKYTYDLFDDFLPFMDKFVIDHELGAFMTNVDRDGTLLNTIKNTWYCGRGIWVYSFLYNNLDKQDRYLDIADKAVDFILTAPARRRPVLAGRVDQEGDPILPRDSSSAASTTPSARRCRATCSSPTAWPSFQGHRETRATGTRPRRSSLKCVRLFDKPDYAPNAAQIYLGRDAPSMPGARLMGVWHAAC